MPNELAVRGEDDERDTKDEAVKTISETDLFRVGRFAPFRGIDGVDFNIPTVTKPIKREKIGPRTKIKGKSQSCFISDPFLFYTSLNLYCHFSRLH